MRKLRAYILIIGTFLACSVIHAQKAAASAVRPGPDFLHFSIEDGLPSSETYFVHQDKLGYIWICTDRGVVRYDGFSFKLYTTADGLIDNVVFEVYEDYRGRLWFLSIRRGLCYYENGKIIPYRFNDKIRKLLANNSPIDKDLYIDTNDNIYYGLLNWGSLKITADGQISERKQPMYSICIDSIDQVQFLSLKRDHDAASRFNIYTNGRLKLTLKPESAYGNISKNDGEKYLLISNTIISLKDFTQFHTDNIRTLTLYIEGNNLWTGNLREGVVLYDLSQKDREGKPRRKMTLLNDHSVTQIMKDRDGGYWFATLEDGIFYCRDIHFMNLDSDRGLMEDNVISLTDVRTNMLLGYNGSNWQTLSPPYIHGKYGVSNPARFCYLPSRGVSFTFNLPKNTYLPEMNYGDVRIIRGPGANRYAYNARLDRLISGASFISETRQDAAGKYHNELVYPHLFQQYARELTINALLLNDQGEIYFGTTNGLYRLTDTAIVKMIRATGNELFGLRMTDLQYNSSWRNIAGTRGSGLFTWEDNRVLLHIHARNGLLSDDVNKLYVDGRNRLWVCTNQGINIIENIHNSLKIHRVTEENGLISNEVNDVVVRGNTIWAATKRGISIFSWSDVLRQNDPSVFLSEVKLDGNTFPKTKPCALISNQNIQFTLGSTNFRKTGNHLFRFRMTGSDWQQTTTNIITINHLSAGSYELEVQEMQTDGSWGTSHFLYYFEVNNPFYLHWYAFLVYGLLLLLVFYLFYRYRISQLKRRHFRQNHLLQLERRALQAQMNPHFIFNSLNSIQSFLVFNETEKAERYLLKFSHLVRRILNNSVAEEIPIREEIQTLREYLALEKMRFRERFEYAVNVALSEEQVHRLIPGMLIQPFVENALIHGFKGFESGGKVTLSFEMASENSLLCVISDNGIGFDAHEPPRKSKHVSHGIRITSERLRSYSKDGMHYYIKIEANPEGPGTRVELLLPVS